MSNSSADNRAYLGDAVYASFDGWQIELRTGDGNNQVIYLDPSVMANLVDYANRCWQKDVAREEVRDSEELDDGC